MRLVLGIFCILAGAAVWGLAISALVAWLAFCFGSVIVGLLLLLFMPYALLAPLAIGVPGSALFISGLDMVVNKKEKSIFNE